MSRAHRMVNANLQAPLNVRAAAVVVVAAGDGTVGRFLRVCTLRAVEFSSNKNFHDSGAVVVDKIACMRIYIERNDVPFLSRLRGLAH